MRAGRTRWLAAVAVLALAACGDGAERSEDTGEVTASGDVGAFDVRVGDCVNDPAADAPTATEVSDVPAVPCDQEHSGEVYHLFDLEDADEYPGEQEVVALADEGCVAEFEAFVGLTYEQSRLEYSTLYPSKQSWEELDDREVVCIVVDPAGPLTGSVRGLGEAAAADPGTSAGAAPAVGSCLDASGEPVDCAAPHDSELYALPELPEGAWPGQDAVNASAEQACLDEFAGYVGVPHDQSALEFGFLTPDEAAWAAGDRQVWCVVGDPAGQLTGTVRGSGR